MGQSTTKGTAPFPPPCSHPGLPVAPLQSLLPMVLVLSMTPAQLHFPNSARCCHWKALCVQAGDWDNCTKALHAAGRRDMASLCRGRWNQAFSPQALKLMECPYYSLGLCPYAHYNITIANETQVPPGNMLERLRNLHIKAHQIFGHTFLMYHPQAMDCWGPKWFCHHCVRGKGSWDNQWIFDCPYSPYW